MYALRVVEPTDRAGTIDDPAADLAAVVALRRLADRTERDAVERALGCGWTWERIARALGVTRQAVHQKHAARIRATHSEERS